MLDLWITYGDRLIDGAVITVRLVALACMIGLVLAVPLALARRSDRPLGFRSRPISTSISSAARR